MGWATLASIVQVPSRSAYDCWVHEAKGTQPIAMRAGAALPGAKMCELQAASRTLDCTPDAAPLGACCARCSVVALRSRLCGSAQEPHSADSLRNSVSYSQALCLLRKQSLTQTKSSKGSRCAAAFGRTV